MSSITIVESMKVQKGVKNVFDFRCEEMNNENERKIVVTSYENSTILKSDLKFYYFFKANQKNAT